MLPMDQHPLCQSWEPMPIALILCIELSDTTNVEPVKSELVRTAMLRSRLLEMKNPTVNQRDSGLFYSGPTSVKDLDRTYACSYGEQTVYTEAGMQRERIYFCLF